MSRRTAAIICYILLTVLALAACGSALRTERPSVASQPLHFHAPSAAQLAQARSELAALETPPGVSASDFADLKAALDKLLAARQKAPSALPNQQKNTVADAQVVDDGAGGFNLTWTYKNVGDYGQNGEVGISDLTPLGSNLGKTSSSGGWASAQAADGDGNGAITIADITPIGANLGAQVSGYHIYQGSSASGPWFNLGSVALGDAAGSPKGFSFPLGASAPAFIMLAPYDANGDDWVYSAGSGPPAAFTPGTEQTGSNATIGSGGGTLAGPTGTPLDGVHIDIPAGALPDGTNVTLDYNDGSVIPAAGVWEGPVLEVHTTDPDNEFEQPIDITLKYTDSADYIPIPYYIDPDGAFQACDLKSIDEANGTYTFSTWHASEYTTIKVAKGDSPATKYDTGFKPDKDGFQVQNFSSPYTGGNCAGMSMFCAWYYTHQAKPGFEPALWGSYMYPVGDLKGQSIIAVRAHISQSRRWDDYQPTLNAQDNLDDEEKANIFKNMMINQAAPVMLYVKAPGSAGARDAVHCVHAYAFDDDSFKIWDPNSPAPQATPDLGLLSAEGFANWVNGGYTFTKFAYMGIGSIKVAEPFNHILQEAKAQFASPDSTIDLQSPDSGSTLPGTSAPVTLAVHSSEVLVERLKVHVHHLGDDTSEDLVETPAAGDNYSFSLPLKSGDNEFFFTTQGHDEHNAWIDTACNFDDLPYHLICSVPEPRFWLKAIKTSNGEMPPGFEMVLCVRETSDSGGHYYVLDGHAGDQVAPDGCFLSTDDDGNQSFTIPKTQTHQVSFQWCVHRLDVDDSVAVGYDVRSFYPDYHPDGDSVETGYLFSNTNNYDTPDWVSGEPPDNSWSFVKNFTT